MKTVAILHNGILSVKEFDNTVELEEKLTEIYGNNIQWSVINDIRIDICIGG